MGARGPVPKRSDQRVRRNRPDGPVDTVAAVGVVSIPDLDLAGPHGLVMDLYESLRHSAQAEYYEASDWEMARLTMHFLDGLLKSPRVNGQVLSVVQSMLNDLLVTEGARRRVRLEVERNGNEAEVVDIAEMFRQRMRAGS
ncbi:hypothetical protein GCM10023319_23100 [Nocardia iowensis]|uniref:Terminase small subunit n=1 Tax=Nocardia iowensis TaxID=204891 RepID=A0ABX8RU98_NOCIO|nr:hypothetical protein KV110_05385 [Nocardia iowensis]